MQQYGDIHAIVIDIQNTILRQIANRIHELTPILLDVSSAVAELDVLLAWSQVSQECNFVRPDLSDDYLIIEKERRLNRQNGRHPLQELVTDQFIPNDISVITRL